MTDTLNKTSDSPVNDNSDPKSLYGSLSKTNDPLTAPQENTMLMDRDPNQIPEDEREELNADDRVEWQNLKKRWDNIGTVYERLNQCLEVLKEEESLFGIQQLDNAKKFIGNAKAELEKAFNYECAAITAETKIPNMLETPWAVGIKSKPREVKQSKESVFLHEEVDEPRIRREQGQAGVDMYNAEKGKIKED